MRTISCPVSHVCAVIAIVVSASYAITVTGTVKNAGGEAIAGAVVKLCKAGVSDTTDASGTFSVTASSNAVIWQSENGRVQKKTVRLQRQ